MNRRVAAGLMMTALAAGALTWWWSRRPAPVEGPPRFAHPTTAREAAPSTFTLPIRVPYADLGALVASKVPEVVVDLQGEEIQAGWAMDLRVTRPGDVWVRGDGDRLVIEVPIKVDARLFRSKRAERRAERGREDGAGVAVGFEAALELGMALVVEDDWTLRSTTDAGVRWVDPPTATIGGLAIPIRKPVERALLDKLSEVVTEVDTRLVEEAPVRKGVEKAWSALGSARQLSDDPPMWLIGRPESLSVGPLEVGDDALQLMAGYRGRFGAVLGDPGPQPPPPPLPPRRDPDADAGFELVLPIALSWDALSERAMGEIRGMYFASERVSSGAIEATGIALYPSGDHVVVRLDWSATHPTGSAVGTAWLSGRPELDPTARSVRITGFDYRLDTSSSAIWGANAIAESQLEAWVREQLVFPYGDRLDAALNRVNTDLFAGRAGGRSGSVTGSVTSVAPVAVTITEAALLVEIRAAGEAALAIEPKPPRERPGPPGSPLERGGHP